MREFPYFFGPCLPDLPALNNPGVLLALNCIPAGIGYRPIRNLNVLVDTALNGTVIGAYSALSATDTSFTYAGTTTKLYQISAGSVSDISRLVGGGYTTASDERWEIEQFGNSIIATNFADDVQTVAFGGGNFAALGGSPPKAKHIGIVRDFVVLGNLNDGAFRPQTVRWSAFNNSTGWTNGTDQAGEQDLFGKSGPVQRVIGGEYGRIYQENSIRRMTYSGPPVVFAFDEVERNRGALAPGAVISKGDLDFYLSNDGFYAFNGSVSTPIGNEKVDKTFFNELDASALHLVSSALDPINKVVIWAYPTGGGMGTYADRLILYNWANDKWSFVDLDMDMVFSALSTAYTLDGLTAVSSSLDALPASLDSTAWAGGSLLLSAFDTSHKLSLFAGDKLTASITSPEAHLNQGGTSYVDAVRPLCDGTPTVEIGTREKQQDAVLWTLPESLNDIGEADFRSDAKYHRVRLNVGGDWNEAHGIDVNHAPSGGR